MKDDIVQLVFVTFLLVSGAAAEELLPVFAGVGFPVLLSIVLVMSTRSKVLPLVMLAVGAGAFEDAMSALPPLTSISYFTVAALVARKVAFPRPFLAVLFPVYALWIGMCCSGPMGDVFARASVSLPLGAAAYGFVWVSVGWAGGRVGLDA